MSSITRLIGNNSVFCQLSHWYNCCRRSSVFRVRKTLLLLHFDAFLSWLVVKTGSGVQILTPTHSFLMLFSVFVTYQLQVGRVFKSRQRKKLLSSLCVQAPIGACRKKHSSIEASFTDNKSFRQFKLCQSHVLKISSALLITK